MPRDYPGDVLVDGKVVEVEDGDTFWVYRGGKIDKVRVQGIDTPESVMGQAYGKEATEELKRMILGKTIDVRYDQNAEKTYGRYVGEIWSKDGKTDYSYEMLKKGAAWSFDAFNRGTWRDGLYDAQMATSKAAKVGLWADPNATNPSTFRHWF
jgi:micrococcal nuclease